MRFREQEAQRHQLLESFDTLLEFVAKDPDFRGNRAYEQRALGLQRQSVEDGKYRVVFLGTFNVGKSTAINAFLGGAFLPMDVEECTSRLTFIQRGPELELRLLLDETPMPSEIGALEQALDPVPATVAFGEVDRQLLIRYPSPSPAAMRESLEPLVTVLADETFPDLRPLRERIEEITMVIPASVLQEDILFVDTPGVHAISESRQEVTYNVIDRSHLVVDFVDSAFAGNVHDLNFIKRIMKWRGRHVFFVLNKADKLDSEDLDTTGQRGPTKALREAFRRHELPDNADLFFLSGYRALRGLQLRQRELNLEDLEEDNRLGIPPEVEDEARNSADPRAALADYLIEVSRFPELKERLLEFLARENRVGTVLRTAGRFLWGRADSLMAPLENELHLAQDPSKFEDLRAQREVLREKLERMRAESERLVAQYRVKCKGGRADGALHPGYTKYVRERLTREIINQEVVLPALNWLRDPAHLKEARRQKFKPLFAQLEHHVDEHVSGIVTALQQEMTNAEHALEEHVAHLLSEVRGMRIQAVETPRVPLAPPPSTTANYAAPSAHGALVGAAAGAVLGSVVPIVGTAIGAGIGSLVGAVGVLVSRLTWNEARWLQKLEPIVRSAALDLLIQGVEDAQRQRVAPVVETLTAYVHRRCDVFCELVQGEVDNATGNVQREIDDLLAREDEIRREREAIISRLQPKVALLQGLRETASGGQEQPAGREVVSV
ncbi:MAG: dynamin family protein [Candidatus Hydrogenedentes bacterium]|nr:dynamin family protein [Candidatus Hydrogenedentota bacterium]